KRTRTKALKKHADLTKDLNLLTIKAPAEGVVYYGNCTDGNWSNTAALIGKLKKEATAPANSILMTIVELRPMYVVSTVGEAQRPSVEKGQQATIAPTGDEKQEIKAKVSDVSAIPVGPGKFSLELELEGEDQPEWLVPGMTGKAKV